MVKEREPDKNVTGGTGITAGGGVTLSNISGTVIIGGNIPTGEKNEDSRRGNEAIKNVVYQAEFQGQSLTRTMPGGTQETSPVNLDEINQIKDVCKDYRLNTDFRQVFMFHN